MKDALALVPAESATTDAEYPVTGKNKTMEELKNRKRKLKKLSKLELLL